MSSIEEKLSNFLKTGRDWARSRTSIPGVFVVKMPAYKNSPARLALEINPVDASGNPIKKRGLIIRNVQELEEFKKTVVQDKLNILLKAVEKVNPQKTGSGEEVVEV
ncbi:MAG: hypothetical protein ACPL07_02150 [Candidatus Bathyarchaeia archaeon]